jgi:glycerol-3-phosphate acyltransferase PlsX
MKGLTTISLDVMSGDHGLDTTIPAAINYLNKNNDVFFLLVGDEKKIETHIKKHIEVDFSRIKIIHAPEVINMDDSPIQALKTKNESSMRRAIDLVKTGAADGCVSSGNTGALMAIARYVLKTLPSIDRPAIESSLPSVHSHTHMLDLGANVECRASHLLQFAIMGSVLSNAVDEVNNPAVGLLNVGKEMIKGNDQVKEANELLESSHLNYVGYIEGDDIFCGDVDVVICDGFVGNIALKASEGLARLVSAYIKEEFRRNTLTKIAGISAAKVLQSFKNRVDPRVYNGASLLGLNGVVVKSHGSADSYAFEYAINIAKIESIKNVPQMIGERLELLQNVKTA